MGEAKDVVKWLRERRGTLPTMLLRDVARLAVEELERRDLEERQRERDEARERGMGV